MATDLILICHGQTIQRDGNRLYGWWANMSLSHRGKQQALLIGERLKHDFDIAAIYTSPLQRAQQTASLVGDVVQVIPTAEHALRELDSGDLSTLSYGEAKEHYPEVIVEGKTLEEAQIPNSETYAEMHHRVASAINRIIKQSPNQQIVCITHGGPVVAYLRAAMGYTPEQQRKPRFQCRPASIHHLQMDLEGERTVVALNDVAHLTGLPDR